MPIRVNFNSFIATEGRPGTLPVTLTGLSAPWDIIAPTTIGQSATSQLDLNRNNSNIWDAVFISPRKFIANVSGMSNPNGGISNNFALDTSRLMVDAQIEMPFFGRAWDFVLQDTSDLTFGQDIDKIEFVIFRINTTNGFPVEAIEQLFFLDENNHIIDSLLTPEQQILAPAPCNGAPDYRVTSPATKMTEITFYKSRMLPLKNCKKIVTREKLQTTNSATDLVKFYSDYNINVRLGLRVKFDVNL